MEPWRYKTTGATLDVPRAFEVACDDMSIQRFPRSGLRAVQIRPWSCGSLFATIEDQVGAACLHFFVQR